MKVKIQRETAKNEFLAWLTEYSAKPITNEKAAFDKFIENELCGLPYEISQFDCIYKRPMTYSPNFKIVIENDQPAFYRLGGKN